jgi:putative hydrolase of the HAD superfamily
MGFTTLYFDLDDTLYPSDTGLWDAIGNRMNTYMQKVIDKPMEEIAVIRRSYLEQYGTTLRGLLENYKIDASDYLAYVHDLPLEEYIQPDPLLRDLLISLPQKRWIFTNADHNHAGRVLKVLGLEDCFNGIIDILAVDFVSKPNKFAYQRALAIAGEKNTSACVIFDDSMRNLSTAEEMGFYTVLVSKNGSQVKVDQKISSLHELTNKMPELWADEVTLVEQ